MARRNRTSTKKQANDFGLFLEADEQAVRTAIAMLYGKLPDWLPEPVLPRIQRAIAALREAEQSDERISELVATARDARLVDSIPGTVWDVNDFLKSAYDLAHVQWALSLGKARAIKELGGNRAARDYQRSKSGNDALYGTEDERHSRDRNICAQAAALRERNSKLSINAIAKQLAPDARLSPGHIKRILRSGT